jgi:SAM-dependent methyltransferase
MLVYVYPSDAMKGAAMTPSETERVRVIQDRQAPKYDRQISFFERVLFGDERSWVCSQARGRVLELACDTVRNLPFYGADVGLTAIELSPAMLAIGRQRAEELGHPADLRLGDVEALDSRTSASTW